MARIQLTALLRKQGLFSIYSVLVGRGPRWIFPSDYTGTSSRFSKRYYNSVRYWMPIRRPATKLWFSDVSGVNA
jgi:hypothetical protein